MTKIELPTEDSPGFLRRTKRSIELMLKASDPQNNPDVVDEVIEFI